MKKIILSLLSISITAGLNAQINVQWESRYQGANGNTTESVADMVVDPSGNVYVTGSAYSATSGFDIVTVKYNNAGVQQWVATFNGSGNGLDEARALSIDASGNVYVTGYAFRGGSNYDYTTIKYNNAGVQQWQSYYDVAGFFDDARDIAVDASGNVYVTGGGQVASNNTNYRTVKYNSAGVQQWAQNYSSAGNNLDMGLKIALDVTGNVYVTGVSFATGQDLNFYTIKYNPAGTQQWATAFNTPLNSYDNPTAIALDASGNVFVAGYSYNGATSDDDIKVIKMNTSGTIVNTATFNGTANSADSPSEMIIGPSGNVYVCGKVKNTGTSEDFWIGKFDNSLNLLWNDSYNGGSTLYDEAKSIALDGTGNVYVAGYSYLTASNNDFLTAKYDGATGSRIWTTRFNGTANNSDQAKRISVDGTGNVYVSGDSKGSGTGTDYSTIKYCQLTTNAGPDQQICVGDSVQLNATGASNWNWVQDVATLSATNINNPYAKPNSTTTYIVSSTDGNNCTDYDTVVVVVNPLPGPTITASGPTTFCIGDSVTLTASGFSSYLWNTSSTNPAITVYSSGTYTVTVTDSMGCMNSTDTAVVTNPLPSVDAGTAAPYCVGDSVQLNASNANSYVWTANPNLSATNIPNPYCTATSNMTFYVQGTDGNGCKNTDSVSVTVNPLPNPPTNTFVTSNSTLVTNCNGAIQWYMNGTAIPAPQGTGQVYSLTANGTYWVTCTNANNCTSPNSDTVTVADWSVGEYDFANAIGLYPNPTSGNFTLQITLTTNSFIAVDILDLTGKVLHAESRQFSSGNATLNFDQTYLAKGVYFVRITKDNASYTKRLIIQ